MRRSREAAALLLLAMSLIGDAQTSAQGKAIPQSPEQFVRTLIQREQKSSRADQEALAGFHGAEGIYSARLLAMIHQDRKAAHGEVGKLDGDPVCDCQDSGGLTLSGLKVVTLSGSAADVLVALHFPAPEDRNITYHLQLALKVGESTTSRPWKYPAFRRFFAPSRSQAATNKHPTLLRRPTSVGVGECT